MRGYAQVIKDKAALLNYVKTTPQMFIVKNHAFNVDEILHVGSGAIAYICDHYITFMADANSKGVHVERHIKMLSTYLLKSGVVYGHGESIGIDALIEASAVNNLQCSPLTLNRFWRQIGSTVYFVRLNTQLAYDREISIQIINGVFYAWGGVMRTCLNVC